MQVNDIVQLSKFVNRLRPGTVIEVDGDKAIVRWVLGSGWTHTVEHDKSDLKIID